MSFSCQKGEFDRCFNRLDRPVEESRPDRQPDRPVDPTGAGRPGPFPPLSHIKTGVKKKVEAAKRYTLRHAGCLHGCFTI